MTRLVQVALAEDVTEAEEIQAILQAAGITSELETAVEHHPRSTEDVPQKVLVEEGSLEATIRGNTRRRRQRMAQPPRR